MKGTSVTLLANAVRSLELAGCEAGYLSSAVDPVNQKLESVIHELSHAVVCKLPLDKELKVLKDGKWHPDSLTQRIKSRLDDMAYWAMDRNEENSLAVSMVVLDMLGVKYRAAQFVSGVGWHSKRPHGALVKQARARPTTERHARRIVRYLRTVDATWVPIE